MKPTLSILALAAALLLTGCETYVADRRPVHRSSYSGHRYDHDRHDNRGHSSTYRRSRYDNDYNRRDVVVVNPSRVTGRTGVVVSSSRGPTPYRKPRSW